MSPLVSVVITSFNREQFIGEAIESVLAQTYSNLECIVVDDGSTDNTIKVVNTYVKNDKRVSLYSRPSQMPKGANACRNYGFSRSKGEYVNWLDDDDLLHHQKLEKQLAHLMGSSFDFSICQIQVFRNTRDQIMALRTAPNSLESFLDGYLRQQFWGLTHASIWRRSFLESKGLLFDLDLQASQEWEFYMRALSNSPEIHFMNELLVYTRVHDNNLSANEKSEKKVWNYFLSRNKIYRLFGTELSTEHQEFLRKFLLERFRESIVFRYDQTAFRIFELFIRKEKKINRISKLKYWLAIYSFKWFGRGNMLIKNIEYR